MNYFGTPLVDGKPDPALASKNYNVADSVIQYDDRWLDLLVNWTPNWTPNDSTAVRSRFYNIDSQRHWRDVEAYRYKPCAVVCLGDCTRYFVVCGMVQRHTLTN